MTDKEFLTWLWERLVYMHGENPGYDYMSKLASIIDAMDPEKITPNTGGEKVRP